MRLPPAFLGLAVLSLGCGHSSTDRPSGRSGHGGIFSFNEAKALRSLFPLTITQVAEQRIASQIYEGLVRFDPLDLSVTPALAESWQTDTTGTVYTFHLRQGIRFQDDPAFVDGEGRELTATDVVRCFDAVCEKGIGDKVFWVFQDRVEGANAYHGSGMRNGEVAGIRALNDRTVEIRLTRPSPNFLESIAGSACWIWPQELLTAYGQDLFEHAIGTGPFRMKVARADEAIVLERNGHYWGTDRHGEQLPYLDGVRITLVPDKEKEIAEFLKGRLSMVTELSLESIDVLADSMKQGEGAGGKRFKLLSVPALAVQYYGFNASQPPFDDVRVRRAFGLAIDRGVLVDSVLRGIAVKAEHGLVAPGLPMYPYQLVPGIPFRPDSARRLLAQAGYPGGKGFPRIQLQVNNDGFGYRQVAGKVQDMLWRELGVAVTVSMVAPKEYYDRIEHGKALLWREGWVADLPDPDNFLALLYGKNAAPDTSMASPFNTTRYSDPQFDALYGLSLTEMNEAKRMGELAHAEQLAMHDVPLLPLYHDRYMLLVQPNVLNMKANPLEQLDLREVRFDEGKAHAAVPAMNS
jgi:peptide/nickel transport system substrate-binding protein